MNDFEARIRERVTAREKAAEILALVRDEAEPLAAAAKLAFWEALRDAAVEQAPLPAVKVPPIEPMSDTESRSFEQQPMQFGKHVGQPIRDVPLDYLEWLAESSRTTARDIARYLLSRRVASEQDLAATETEA